MAAACQGVDSQDLATILNPFRAIFARSRARPPICDLNIVMTPAREVQHVDVLEVQHVDDSSAAVSLYVCRSDSPWRQTEILIDFVYFH